VSNRAYIVGRRYRVPCVSWQGYLTPILGPMHEDAEHIGFKHQHWHIDFRFVSKQQWEGMRESYADYSRVHGKVITADKAESGVVYVRRKCLREMPVFPRDIPDGGHGSMAVPWLSKLESAYADKRLNLNCMTCPHRGLPLDGIAPKNGVLVCPGHGLAWDVSTGRLHPRVSASASSPHTPEATR
jgi:hypothetical protein